MACSPEFQSHLEDVFASFEGVSLRRMFGGLGVFRGGLMFALVSDDTLYFKVDAQNRSYFEEEGMGPFVYETKGGKRGVMSYFEAPDHLLDDREACLVCAESAFAAALRADEAKPESKRKRK